MRFLNNKGGFTLIDYLLLSVVVVVIVLILVQVKNNNETPNDVTVVSEDTEIPEADLTVVVIGDSGTGTDLQKQIAEEIEKVDYDIVLHTGDVAYGDGSEDQIQRKFDEIYSEKFKSNTYPTLGNHDYGTDNGQPYLDYFDLPKQALNDADNERYYSFDRNGIHFVALDTNDPLEEISDDRNDDMADWLEADLENAPDSRATVVFMHHPPFSSGKYDNNQEVIDKLVPIFEKHGVDMVLSGHDHNYQRNCAIFVENNQPVCTQNGITYIVTGGGGREPYPINDNPPDNLVVGQESANFVVLSFMADKISGTAVNELGNTLDEFEVTYN